MIEMLLENPFIIIILLGILSSFFGKSKNEESGQRRPRSEERPPIHRPERPQIDIPKVDNTLFKEKKGSRQPETIFENMSSEAERQYKVLQQVAQIERAQKQATVDDDIHSILERRKKTSLNNQVTKNDELIPTTGTRLVDGIIFAEILGKPRAKNPHTSQRL